MTIPLQPTVTIPVEEYERLKRSAKILAALEAGGVDNWEWYADSINEHCPEVWE